MDDESVAFDVPDDAGELLVVISIWEQGAQVNAMPGIEPARLAVGLRRLADDLEAGLHDPPPT